jgi:hypothetical protein
MKALALYHHYSRSAFALLAFVCAASVFLYGVFLLEAVAHTAARARAAEAVTELKSKLSDVESQYLVATQAITPARAQALGFVPPKTVATVYAANPSQVLTLQTTAFTAQR